MKNNFLRVIFLFILFFAAGNSPLLAKEVPIELSLDTNTVEIGESVRLGLIFNNVQGVAAPQLPEMDGFKSQYLGPSTVMSVVNGKMSSSVTHRYVLIPIKVGKFTLGPFTASDAVNTYRSDAKEITVVERGQAPAQKSFSTDQPQSEEKLNERIFLTISADKTKAYVNEKIPVTIKLYINQLAVRDIPQYPALQEQGYLKEQFVAPKQYRQEIDGITYDVVEFNTAIYPTREGEIKLGPAELTCNIAVKKQKSGPRSGMGDFFDRDFFDDSFFGDFFTRLQISPVKLTSTELTLNISGLPQENKPAQFSGAVGKFKMEITGAPKEVTAGDPITLKTRISGEGNFDSVNIPVLDSAEGFKIYQPEVKKEQNAKIFEQVIIPQSEKITQIPAIKFVYFDTEKKEYVTLEEAPIPIKVSAAREKESKIIEASAPSEQARSAKTQILGQDIVYIKEEAGDLKAKGRELYKNGIFIILQFFPLVFLATAIAIRRRKDRLTSDIRYARMRHAPKIARKGLNRAKECLKNNQPKEFYDYIFKTLQEYLGHRFSRPSASITVEVVDELIAGEGLDKSIAEKLKTCFFECDIARYSASGIDKEKMKNTLQVLEEAIDYLERKMK